MPPRQHPEHIARVPQEVADISKPTQLISYAASGQLEQVTTPGLSLRKIAHAAGLGGTAPAAASELTKALRSGPSPMQLQQLDEIIGALAPDLEQTGGLCSLALRLTTERRDRIRGSLTAHVPPSWTSQLLKNAPADDLGALIQASALLSAFQAAGNISASSGSIQAIRYRYRQEMPLLVRRLILISAGPPTPRNIDAQVMLGSLASYDLQKMQDILEHELRYSPLGFRIWRAITKLVKLSPTQGEHAEALRSWVRRLMDSSEELRKSSLYAGRSLDLELAITVPAEWSRPKDDWVSDALLTRARNKEATIRERGTAAMGLWQRAIGDDRDLDQARALVQQLITEFEDPDDRPDARAGLEWIVATLKQVMEPVNGEPVSVCNEWPEIDAPWFRNVQEAAKALDNMDIPPHLLVGTKNLFRHMILQNAGVYRRQAVETVATSGLTKAVARALGILLRNEQEESWIRIRAVFALGFLQRRDDLVEADLVRACMHACENLKLPHVADDPPLRAHITEMHTSLFAIGDCFGAPGAEDRAKSARQSLQSILTELAFVEGDNAKILRRATRAAGYLLTVCSQPREDGAKDLSEELLERLSHHPDKVTQKLSKWALSFRFANDGKVRPLLAAVEYGQHTY